MRPIISVVVPMYNEQEVINTTHERLMGVMQGMNTPFEVIYVNDGSRDGTLGIVSAWAKADARVRLVDFSRNFGHQAAVTCGLSFAHGDAIVIIDADLQDPPELIPTMFERWKQGIDVVYGKRLERKGETAFKKLTASMFYRFLSFMTDGLAPKDTGDFRLIDRKVCTAILAMPEHSRFLRGMVAWVGFRQEPLEYVREPRFAGATKYPLKKMLKLASDGVFSFSFKPLKFLTALGAFLGSISLLWALIALILGGFAAHWLGALVLFCTGLLLLAMGLTGEYLSRMFEEGKGRPHYLVRTTPDEFYNGEKQRGQIDET